MALKERAKVLVVELQELTLRNRPAVIEAPIRDAENDIIVRLESQADTLTPASGTAIARELMHLWQERSRSRA